MDNRIHNRVTAEKVMTQKQERMFVSAANFLGNSSDFIGQA